MPIDLVIPLGPHSFDGTHREVRYAIRSAVRHVRGRIGKLVVLGHRPAFLWPDLHREFSAECRKSHDLLKKLTWAAENPEISDPFLYSSDDQLFVADVDLREYTATSNGELEHDLAANGNRFWTMCQTATWEFLAHYGAPKVFYDTHVPHVLSKEAILRAVKLVPYRAVRGLAVHSLIYNLSPPPAEKVWQLPKVKAQFETAAAAETGDKVRERIERPGVRFCGYDDSGLQPPLATWLKRHFRRRSKWESY